MLCVVVCFLRRHQKESANSLDDNFILVSVCCRKNNTHSVSSAQSAIRVSGECPRTAQAVFVFRCVRLYLCV
jgi:hypothetical protein